MKTLLIKLPANLDDKNDYDQILHPYGILSIQSYLKNHGHDSHVIDCQALHLERKEIIESILKMKPDLLGFTCITSELPMISSLLHPIKEAFPNLLVILGGPHPTIEYKAILEEEPNVDIICIGEGEYTFLDLIKTLDDRKPMKNVLGIAFRNNGKIVINERRPPIEDLDSLPYADWDAVPMDEYFHQGTARKNYGTVFGSRGCFQQCTFCAAPKILGRVWRHRSPKNIVEEIKILYDKHMVREVNFEDSWLNVSNIWLRGLCKEIKEMNKTRPIIWRCNIRADATEEETVKLMKESGCVYVTMGVESGNPIMLKLMKKGESLDDFMRAAKIYKKYGIDVVASFIIGLPGETLESINDTLNFAKKIPVFICTFNPAMPFPGTEFYDTAIREGNDPHDMLDLKADKINYVPQGMTEEELKHAWNEVNRKYHLRLGRVLKVLSCMRSWANFKIHLRSMIRLLRMKV